MELVSVIIPTHNSETLVTHAIDSVIAQTYPHIEIIVVDDGSADNTVTVARTNLQKHCKHNWQVLERGSNGGPSITRNVGLRTARGAWIQFLDSDDLLAATKIERQMAVGMNAPSDVAAVHSSWKRGSIRAGHTEWEGQFCTPNIEGKAPIMCLVKRVRPLLGAALVRRTVLEQIRGFNESLRFWECEEINVRIAKVGRFKQVPSNEPLYFWRRPRDKDYIGGSEAKYRATQVALGWIEQVLRATGNQPIDTIRLPKQDLRFLLDECTGWARQLYSDDREAFEKYMIRLRTLEPRFRPKSPWHLSIVSLCITYERAEVVAEMMRRPRHLVRRALCKLALKE